MPQTKQPIFLSIYIYGVSSNDPTLFQSNSKEAALSNTLAKTQLPLTTRENTVTIWAIITLKSNWHCYVCMHKSIVGVLENCLLRKEIWLLYTWICCPFGCAYWDVKKHAVNIQVQMIKRPKGWETKSAVCILILLPYDSVLDHMYSLTVHNNNKNSSHHGLGLLIIRKQFLCMFFLIAIAVMTF